MTASAFFTKDTCPSRKAPDFTRPGFCVLGAAFDDVSMSEVLQLVKRAADPVDRRRLVISTPNVNQVVASQSDAGFRDSIARSDLVVVDGMPLVWLARLLGVKGVCRLAGSDLFEQMEQGGAGQMRVFFFGGPDGVAEGASELLNQKPGPLQGVGGLSPGFGTVADMASDEKMKAINAADADFVVVALGAVKGQHWIDATQDRMMAPVVSHLGAVVNFVAGTVRRAPRIMQVTGFEWLWRIMEEPTLWRRYFNDGKALAGLLTARVLPLVLKRASMAVREALPARVSVFERTGGKLVVLTGDWCNDDAPTMGKLLNSLTEQPQHIDIKVTGVRFMDHRVVAQLLRLRGFQQSMGMRFHMHGAQSDLMSVLRMHCAEHLVDTMGVGVQPALQVVTSAVPV